MAYLTGSFFQIVSDAMSSLTSSVSGKVDKITGKGLSTNDYDATAKGKVDGLGTASTHAASDFSSSSITVNGHALSSNVTVSKSDVGLGNVDNTSDSSKPVSSATQTALNAKFTVPTGSSSQYIRGDGSLSTLPAVPSSTDSLSEGSTNLYYTDTRAKAAYRIVSGTTTKSGAYFAVKSAAVSSGTVTFHFTNDGTSTGTALFPNGPDLDTLQLAVNDATASYQMGWTWSNSNKTVTVTTNKLTTANILTGLLGQAAANGAVVKASVWGN